MSGIYVHLPFCPYICPYCDFAKWPLRRSQAQRYLRALRREIEREPPWRAQTVYLGGGTPNTYPAAQIAKLADELQARFGPFEEISIEINPDLVGPDDLSSYVDAGIDRVSIGVQSMVPTEIATLGRRHAPEDVAHVVAAARAAGMRSVSIDLIFAVPQQTARSWSRTLREALACEPDHVSVYGLTIEEGTPFAAWRARDPSAFFDDVREAEFYDIAIETLAGAGYQQYEVSNFAKPGHECAHNLNYWQNGQYRGFGVGAASYRGGVRWVHTRSLSEYVEAVEAGESIASQRERLVGAARRGEAVMLALRMNRGVRFDDFRQRYGVDFLQFYAPVVEDLRSWGLLDVDGSAARLTKRGLFLANDVCGAFVTFA